MNLSKNNLLLAYLTTLVAFDVVKHKHNKKEENIRQKKSPPENQRACIFCESEVLPDFYS